MNTTGKTSKMNRLTAFVLLNAAFLIIAGGCNDPADPTVTRVDRFMPTTTGTVSGTLLLVDPDPASGLSFPEISGAAQLQIIMYQNLVYSTAVDGSGNPVRLPSVLVTRPLSDFQNDDLELGIPQFLDFTITNLEGLADGDYSVTAILDLNGNGTYDPQDDCAQILPAGTVPVEGMALPVTVSVSEGSAETMDITFIPGATICGPGEAASAGSLSGHIGNTATVPVGAASVLYVSLFYDPASATDPSDGGSIPPDYLYIVPMALVTDIATYDPGDLDVSVSINAANVLPAGTLPPGDYGIALYLSQDGSSPGAVPAINDCWGGAATTFTLNPSGDNATLAGALVGCNTP